MAHEHHRAQVHYGPHRYMGSHPRAQLWKVVPADFIPELRPADLPVDVVERRWPRCREPLGHGLPTNEPPRPQWCHPPAQHVPVPRATAIVSCHIIESGSSRHSRTWRACPAVC
jgi:hypothetical protein